MGSIFGDLPEPKSPQIAILYDLIVATNPIYAKPQAPKSHLKKESIRLPPILQVTSTSGDQGVNINRGAYSQSRSRHEERMKSHCTYTYYDNRRTSVKCCIRTRLQFRLGIQDLWTTETFARFHYRGLVVTQR